MPVTVLQNPMRAKHTMAAKSTQAANRESGPAQRSEGRPTPGKENVKKESEPATNRAYGRRQGGGGGGGSGNSSAAEGAQPSAESQAAPQSQQAQSQARSRYNPPRRERAYAGHNSSSNSASTGSGTTGSSAPTYGTGLDAWLPASLGAPSEAVEYAPSASSPFLASDLTAFSPAPTAAPAAVSETAPLSVFGSLRKSESAQRARTGNNSTGSELGSGAVLGATPTSTTELVQCWSCLGSTGLFCTICRGLGLAPATGMTSYMGTWTSSVSHDMESAERPYFPGSYSSWDAPALEAAHEAALEAARREWASGAPYGWPQANGEMGLSHHEEGGMMEGHLGVAYYEDANGATWAQPVSFETQQMQLQREPPERACWYCGVEATLECAVCSQIRNAAQLMWKRQSRGGSSPSTDVDWNAMSLCAYFCSTDHQQLAWKEHNQLCHVPFKSAFVRSAQGSS